MNSRTKEYIIIGVSVAAVGVVLYFINKREKIKYSNRLRQMELISRDVSGLDKEFLKKWVETAEEVIRRSGGGLPGWEYGQKFNYRGKDYFLKGGTTTDPYKNM